MGTISATGYSEDSIQPVYRSYTIQKPYRFTEISQLLRDIGMMP